MRLIIHFLLFAAIMSPAFSAADDMGFDTFMQSRDVVATLYFPANSDKLATAEQERITATVHLLRKLQEEGRLIRVEGFSSREGSQEANFLLSIFRARNVADLIEAEGLPAEVTLTGYGDLLAKSVDPLKDRRVEIVSYAKPTGFKKVKFADKKDRVAPATVTGLSEPAPAADREIDSLTVDQAIKNKLADKQKQLADKKFSLPIIAPGISKVTADEPIIDALTIEQAIMEKIGAVAPPPTGAVSQVGANY